MFAPCIPLSRRQMLLGSAAGFGYLAFASLATWAAERETVREGGRASPLAPRRPHFPARAKRVIFLCMEGGPSHVDTFDYKPALAERDGRSMTGGRVFGRLMASPWQFARHGQSGLWISELFPELARRADDLCLLRGMHTDVPAHPQAFLQMHTGTAQFKRPSLGAWTLYGLGTANENLPGFVTISPPLQNGGPANYASAFLPAVYQGTPIRTGPTGPGGGPPRALGAAGAAASVSNIRNPRQTPPAQRAQLDFLQSLNREALDREPHDPAIEGAIESFELAFRMQKDLPGVMDVGQESAAIRTLYGLDDAATERFGRQCLLARRLVEAGVRFVEVTSNQWDHHFNMKTALPEKARSVDQPIAGLLTDLKQRGLLDDTLVLWGGEFGRTPYAQGGDGRDHNHKGFTTWMAGGGVRGGLGYGATDEMGYEAVEDKVHIHDWHATILHLLGLDHERLTYRHAGRDMRLTDVKGTVAKAILA